MSPPKPFMPLKYNIHFNAEYIPGKSNIIVGAICRKQWEVFRKETFSADINSPLIPAKFQMISVVK